MSATKRESVLALLLVAALFAWAAWEASGFPGRARVFPQFSSLAGLAATVGALIRTLGEEGEASTGPEASRPDEPERARAETEAAEESGPGADRARSFAGQVGAALPYLLWLGLLYLGVYLIGLTAASGLFLLHFLRYPGELPWSRAAAGAAGAMGVLLLLAYFVNLSLPGGVLLPL